LLYAIGRLRLLPRPLSPWVATLILFLAYVVPAAAMLLYVVHFAAARVTPILFPLPWLSDGVAVSLMLVWGTRTWPGVFLGSIFIWGVMRGDPAVLVGVDALGETLSVVITVQIMRAFHFRRQLDRLADPLILIAAALAGRSVAAVADIVGTVAGVWLTPHSIPAEYLPVATVPGTMTPAITGALLYAIWRWQLNALAGIALMVPALLANARRLRHALRTRRVRLAALCVLSLLWCCGALELTYPWAAWPLLLAALMLVAWAAIDLGALTAATCTLVFAGTAAAAFCQDLGPLASADVPGSLAATWGFIGLLCCVSPVLTVLLSARQHQGRRLTVLAERYRSLFTANPTPAWVADAQSGTILMANAEAVRRYGYTEAEFSRMQLAELAAEHPADAELPRLDGNLVTTPLNKHVTRDGRLIDVELVATPLELDGRPVELVYAIDMTDQQDLRRRLLATVDRESCRLSQELHDGLGQALAGLASGSEALLQRSEQTASLDAADIVRIRELTDQAQQAESSLYQLTTGVSPLENLHGDLLEALRRLPTTLAAAEHARVEVQVERRAPVTLSLERREHLYRLIQDSLADALKHTRAERIVIRALVDAQRIRVSLENDSGDIAESRRAGSDPGLQSIKLRAAAVGAELALQSLPGGGTAVICSCPQAEPTPGGSATRTAPAERRAALGDQPEHRSLAAFRRLTTALLIVLACCAGGLISHALASAYNSQFSYADVRLAVPSLLVGASVSALLIAGRGHWLAVFIGVSLVRFGLMGEPVTTALLLSALGTAGSYAVVALLDRWGFTPSLDRWQDPLVLCAAAAISWTLEVAAGTLVGGLLASAGNEHVAPGVGTLFACPAGPGVCVTPALLAAMVRWWFDGLTGILLVVPTVMAGAALRRVLKENFSELLAWCLSLICGALLLLTVPTAKVLLPVMTVSILLVVWAAARFGASLASLATLVFAMTAAGSFSTHTGALATQDASTGVVYVWGFTAVLTVIGLFLAALLAEHNGLHRKMSAVSKRYRSLFQSDPRPLWLHDARTGEILEANEPAARTYGYPMSDFTRLNVSDLLAPGVSPAVLDPPDDRAIGPLAMKHRRQQGPGLDVEIWSYGTFVDGRRVSVCFAHDVTERNTLRRLLFDRAELESRDQAAELRRTLAAPLAELRIVAHKLLLELARHAPAQRLRELLESLARGARRAAQCCREVAHRLSPLQANHGDLVAALETLRQQLPDGAPLEISVGGSTPLSLDQQQSEHVYGLLSEIVTRCRPGRPGHVVRVVIASFRHMVRVTVEAELPPSRSGPLPSLARHPSVLLRARAMGARLWEISLGGARTRVVCDLPR
jgi:PAS domain S-box-containing protein